MCLKPVDPRNFTNEGRVLYLLAHMCLFKASTDLLLLLTGPK